MTGLMLAAAMLLAFGALARPAEATHVMPGVVAGNPNCVGLGYQFGFKPQPEPPPNGTYFFGGPTTNPPHALTTESVTITNTSMSSFNWSSTIGVDAVIVKGGPNANVYVYDPPAEEFNDTGLTPPINPNNGQPFGTSHIEFCYDWEVDVEKTAEATFTRTFEWDIEKSVTPESWDLFTGDSGTSKYTVEVAQTGFTDSDWAVSGEIWVENNTPLSATVASVSDVVSGPVAATVVCPPLPAVLAPGDSLHCTYSAALPDGSNRTNTATVSTTGQVGGGNASANVVFGNPTTLVNDMINVTDTNGESWQFDDDGMEMYERTFDCDDDEGTHDNTATIDETGQSDSASVTVNCHALGVEKTAETSLTRTWTWTIDKTASHDALTLSPGQVFTVTYWVDVDASSTDTDHAVSGEIWISNPNPALDAELTGVADVVSPAIAATVNCPSLTVPAAGSLHCTYSADLPDDADRTNTAAATLQNNDYDEDGNATPAGTTDFSGTADVDFSTATITEIDEEIDVTDDRAGFLGTVDASLVPASFHYTRDIGPFSDPEDCGENLVENTASFLTSDTGITGDSSHLITVTVPCDEGCTLTPGYWKTHSQEGPAPYDDTWALLGPMQEDSPFFRSGQTYYEVLWTQPRGNAYYILAHAYIAAALNQMNGASIPGPELAAFTTATGLFDAYTPAQIGALRGNNALRQQFLSLATTLDDYNNGITGPGHCSE